MHRPPAATWRAMPAGLAPQAVVALAALACAATLLEGYFMQAWGVTVLCLLLLLLVACTLAALRGLGRMPSGQLRWDGECWHWADGQNHTVTSLVCVLDLQSRMLLRIHCGQRHSLWLWLESRGQANPWAALRRAVVASQHGATNQAPDLL